MKLCQTSFLAFPLAATPFSNNPVPRTTQPMSYLLYILLPILAVLVFAVSVTLRAADSPKSATPAQPAKTPATQTPLPPAREIATFSKAKLRQMLAKIESSPAPEKKLGAMCYDMSAPPKRIEYTCPACNKKTLHVLSKKESQTRWLVSFELTFARRLISEVQKHTPAVSLRENNFCKNCNPKRGTPNLGITIRYDDGTDITTDNITSDDLRIILGFFSGGLAYETFSEETIPLRDDRVAQRLRQLLGEPATPPPALPEKK